MTKVDQLVMGAIQERVQAELRAALIEQLTDESFSATHNDLDITGYGDSPYHALVDLGNDLFEHYGYP